MTGCASPPPAQGPSSASPTPPASPTSPTSPALEGTPAPVAAGPSSAAGDAPSPDAPAPAEPQPAAQEQTAGASKMSARGWSARPGAATATGTLAGSITETDIRDVVEKHGELFDACYQVGLKSSPQFVAKVTVKVTIGPSGRVNRADVVRSTAKNPQVDACVADAFERMLFPPPKGGVTTVVTFPIEFSGLELVQP